MAKCKEVVALDDVQTDLTCVVCLEPLQEARRFDCFHLLCAQCAVKHVEACLHQSDGVTLTFGPVFCPQCRNITYVFSEEGFGLPDCPAVSEAWKQSRQLLSRLSASKRSVLNSNPTLDKASEEMEKRLTEVMARVRSLITKECATRDRIFDWANDEEIDDSLICERNGDEKLQKALATLRDEFEDEVDALVEERSETTKMVEDLLLEKWILEALRQCNGPAQQVEDQWRKWLAEKMEKMETENKGDLEDDDIGPVDTFLLAAIFRLHRPYPGAVLPEHRVKAGTITAELLWSVGQRGQGKDEFNWPIHAKFIGEGDRIAVADKNNARVVILDSSDGRPVKHLFKGLVKPRRVFSREENPGKLFVSDEYSSTIKIFDMETEKAVDTFGHGLFLCPTGVCEKHDKSLVYSDMDKGFISVHDSNNLSLKTKFTARLLGDVYLPSPSYVAVDADDYFVVSDSQNNCIKIFNKRGGVVSRFGSDVLECPRGIAVDPLGLIIVVDSDHHQIQVFDPFGKFVQTLELPGPQLHYPMSLDFRPRERLLLVTQCSFLYHDHSVMLYRLNFGGREIKSAGEDEKSMI